MSNLNFDIAFEVVSFDYFKDCIKNGSTPEQAKAEMKTNKAMLEIADRIKQVLAV